MWNHLVSNRLTYLPLSQTDPLLDFVNVLKPVQQLSIPIQLNISSEEAALQTGVNVQYTGKDNHSLIHRTHSAICAARQSHTRTRILPCLQYYLCDARIGIEHWFAEYLMWEGNATLTVWNSPDANRVGGTDGQNFAMDLTDESVIVSWVDSIFRVANLFVNKTQNAGTAVIRGVTCLWFVEELADYGANPAYWGYGPAGVFNITSASQGA